MTTPDGAPPAGCPSGDSSDTGTPTGEAGPEKSRLRRSIIRQLAALDPGQARTDADALYQLLMQQSWFTSSRAMLVFLPTPQEPDLTAAIADRLAAGVRVGAPRMDWSGCTIEPHQISNLDADLVPARHGLREPGPLSPLMPARELDLVLVPGVAFDARGVRLGRGGGFYDRFLTRGDLRALRVGVAFDLQIVGHVPQLPHDTPVDLVVTPTRVIDARRGK